MANTTTTKTVTWTRGLNVIHAGTPLDTNGKPVMDNTAVGIVAEDLHAPDRTATVITAGEWNESANAPYFHISDEVKRVLSDIEFTPPPAVSPEEILEILQENFVQKTGEPFDDLTDAPDADDFNSLLGVLRASGVIEPPDEDNGGGGETPAAS